MILTCDYCGKLFNSKRTLRKYCSCSCSARANADKRAAQSETSDRTILFSSGGGVQSTAISVLIERGKLPKPDFAIFVDVGFESVETIDYMQRVTIPRLAAVGCDMVILKASDYTSVDLVSDSGLVAIPAFARNGDGDIHKFKTMRNETWKVRVARQYVKEHGATNIENWLGISTDEKRRARSSNKQWVTYRYPLIDMGISRDECRDIITAAGWPMPKRTSCVCCPMRTDAEWLTMKYESPQDFARAEEIERQIQRERPDVFLHKRCVPLAQALRLR